MLRHYIPRNDVYYFISKTESFYITTMLKILLISVVSLFLYGCGSTQDSSGLTPLPKSNDPKDEVLFEAAAKYIASQNAPTHSAYDFERIDLNGDGLRDAIILFKLPHRHWCGWDGCGMVVFKASRKDFAPLSAISGVRGPIYVSQVTHKGWRDIIIRTSGTNLRDKNVLMRFNGTGYPNSPMLAPTLKAKLSDMPTERFFR